MLTPGTAVDFHHDTTKLHLQRCGPPAATQAWGKLVGKRLVNEGLMIQVYMIHDDC